MIPIKIDDKNIDFRNLHLEKIERKIKARLLCKKKSYSVELFEYKVLEWIDRRLKDILIGNSIRIIIQNFNDFIGTFTNTTISPNDKTITIEKLKQICKEKNIRGFSGKNRNELITLVNSNIGLSGEIFNDLKYIFEDFYKNEWDKIEDYDRYTFVTKHNLKTCLYCNMGYILISKRDTKKQNGLRPEIDHFFPKSKYPYLAMSFYNLIPSCQICNHTKKDKDTYEDGLLSPYEIDANTFQLTYIPKNINFFQIKKRKYNTNKSFEIKFKKIDKHSNKYFKLDKLYEQHKDIVSELLIKKTIYSKSYIAELKKNFHFTDDEIYRFLFCNYKNSEEYNKRPLSKLIKDISKELNLTQ